MFSRILHILFVVRILLSGIMTPVGRRRFLFRPPCGPHADWAGSVFPSALRAVRMLRQQLFPLPGPAHVYKELRNYMQKGEYIMFGILIALLSGALMSVQGVFNTEVTKQTSLWVSSAFVQLTALLVCLVVWLAADRTSFLELADVQHKYMLFAGVIGAFITVTVVKSMDLLGPAKAAMLIVIAQLGIAWGIELAGLFGVEKTPFEWKKLFGMLVAIIGIVIFKWKK